MPAKTGRFRRADRILDSRDFKRVLARGERRAARSFVVVLAPSRASEDDRAKGCRVGVTVSKRVGNAVVRNAIKRRVREWFRVRRAVLPSRSNLVVIARAPARGQSGSEVAAALDGLVERGGWNRGDSAASQSRC